MLGPRSQPQGLLRLGRAPIVSGQVLSVLPGVNRGIDVVSGAFPTVVGTKKYYTGAAVSGAFGTALGTATSDRMTTPLTGAFPSATGRTYFFRARRNGAGGGSLGRLFDKTSGSNGQFLMWYAAQNAITYGFYTGTSTERNVNLPTSSVAAAIGEWVDVVVCHRDDGTQQVIDGYINGTQVLFGAISTGSNRDAPAVSMSIGNRADGVRNWDGLIECAYVFDRILWPDEVSSLSQARYQGYFDPNEEDLPIVAVAPAITLNAAWIEQNETTASAIQVRSNLSIAWAEQSEITQANVVAQVNLAAQWTEQNESIAASISASVSLEIRWQEQSETLSAMVSVGDSVSIVAQWTEQSEVFSASVQLSSSAQIVWVEQNESVDIVASVSASVAIAWTEQDENFSLTIIAIEEGTPGDIDASLVALARVIPFERSIRVVAFEGSQRMVRFEGGNRIVRFE